MGFRDSPRFADRLDWATEGLLALKSVGVVVRADPADQKLLLDIQEADLTLRQLQAKLGNLLANQEVSALLEQLHTARAVLRETLSVVESLRLDLERAESDVAMVQARIERDTERAEHTSSAKDAQGLAHELQSLRERLSTLEEVELEIMERLELSQKEHDTAGHEVEALEARLEQAREAARAERETLETQQLETSQAREEIAAKVPGELLALYERQRERYGYGASLLRRGVSGASGVVLTESDLAIIRAAQPDEVLLCPDSNAILIRTEESGIS